MHSRSCQLFRKQGVGLQVYSFHYSLANQPPVVASALEKWVPDGARGFRGCSLELVWGVAQVGHKTSSPPDLGRLLTRLLCCSRAEAHRLKKGRLGKRTFGRRTTALSDQMIGSVSLGEVE